MLARISVITNSSHSRMQRYALVSTMLGLLVALVYMPVLRTSFFSDDYVLLWQARASRFDWSIFQIDQAWFFYRPLGKLLWLIMYRIWGVFPLPYHALSIGLHWLNGLLLIALVQRLMPGSERIALIAGTLFLLLPLHVETIVWSACYYDLLASGFYLLTMWSLLGAWQQRSLRSYLISLGCFQLGLWSKELSFTLPLMILMLGSLLTTRPQRSMLAVSALPYLGLTALNLLQRYLVWGSFGGYSGTNTNVLPRIWTIFATTLTTMIAPLNQLRFPPISIQLWLLVMTVVIIAGLMAGGNQRLIVIALAWIVIAVLPILNLLPIGADLQNSRLLYLPSVGFCIGIAAMLDATAQRVGRRTSVVMSLTIIIGAYMLAIVIQIQPWLVAGRESIHTVQELHRILPALSSKSTLQAQGLPDTYQGAFIYRLGLPEAYDLLYGTRFTLAQVPQIQSLAEQASDDLFQVVFGFDAATQRWEIINARGVTAPAAEDTSFPAITSWDFTNCADRAQWISTPPQTTCQPGGLVVPAKNKSLDSPTLTLASDRWNEIRVIVKRDAATEPQALHLQWTTARDQSWNEERAITLDLRPGDRAYTYHFFIPPSKTPLTRLRITQTGNAPITITNVFARSID